jgi:hypothetical protein
LPESPADRNIAPSWCWETERTTPSRIDKLFANEIFSHFWPGATPIMEAVWASTDMSSSKARRCCISSDDFAFGMTAAPIFTKLCSAWRAASSVGDD